MSIHTKFLTFQEDGSLTNMTSIHVTRGMDNILPNREKTKLYIPSHNSKLKFALAFFFKRYQSPFKLHQLDITTKQIEEIHCMGKPEIGSVSACVIVNNSLYLAQVFNGYILSLKSLNQYNS